MYTIEHSWHFTVCQQSLENKCKNILAEDPQTGQLLETYFKTSSLKYLIEFYFTLTNPKDKLKLFRRFKDLTLKFKLFPCF
ncbi:MAG TPA: hypothetical protein CFH82_03475 [Sulfurospirillum sp. UBA12182]|jgi:hypothetical protein|nr:MAG TPA: hypothetical protein CFH82_03475 [Sulfurospirillum sp. UBA12182]